MTFERVLVVDDDAALLDLMVLSLKRHGYQVEQAEDGAGALKMLTSQPPFSVLVTDLVMPGMTGIELLHEARELDHRPEVIIVTATSDLDTAIAALHENGAYDYLLKPFESMNQLLLAVERAAAYRRLLVEREQLRLEVQHDAERLRALIANTDNAIFSADAQGILRIVNPAAARLLGSDALEGENAAGSLPPALASIIANWQAVGSNLPAVVEMTWADGSAQLVNLSPIPETEPGQWGWVAALRDITHIKRMEEAKSQVLVEVASRVRIPLAQVMNGLMELNLLAIQNEHVSDIVSRLTKIWKLVQEWVEDLNALTRIDSGIDPQVSRIDLEAVLREVYQAQAAALLQNPGVRLELAIEPGLPQAMADPELIRRLFNGLIERAAERSQQGDAVQMLARYHQQQVWVDISDQGPAINDADLAHLFEKSFIKINNGSNATGLEMALVKAIIDHMGGQVWVGGEGQKGRTISVCLPAVDGLSSPA